MLSNLYIPPTKTIPAKILKGLLIFIEKHDFLAECAGPAATAKDLNKNKPTVLVTDMDASATLGDKTMLFAKNNQLALALHYDGTNDDDTMEWNMRSGIFWFNPTTGKIHSAVASCTDPAPHFEAKDILKIATSPYEVEPFLEMLKPLRLLGIEPERKDPTAKQLKDYINARVETREYDAENSTSHTEEYGFCYRNGLPNPAAFDQAEIREEISAAKESMED